jgi:hypothetical protein
VQGSTPSKTKEKPASNVSIREARDVGAMSTLDSFAPTARERERERERELWMKMMHLD